MEPIDYILAGFQAVFLADPIFTLFGLPVSVVIVMVILGFIMGIVVGATPGMAGPMAMAISLPILLSVFGFDEDALLPVMGFLIGIMKGATVGGAVPAILFNTPGTPDSFVTTFDGYPMTKNGQGAKALKVSHMSSTFGDTFSDIVLIICAPFLAITVERYLDLPEKTALIILSLTFIAAVVGNSAAKGVISGCLGLLFAYIGTGEDFYPRLTMGIPALATGFPVTAAILGVLIFGEVFKAIEEMWQTRRKASHARIAPMDRERNRLTFPEVHRLLPYIASSALVGTIIGALPGIGSTMAATLGYANGKRMHVRRKHKIGPDFGKGAPEGVASTEAANSAVSGANLIPVLSLGIPGNAAAVFLILAADSISGFTPGPSVFRFSTETVNTELVMAFGIFTIMMLANLTNWTVGFSFMRLLGHMSKVPQRALLPIVILITLTSVYVQYGSFDAVYFLLLFGVVGYLLKKADMSVLPFVITFILAGELEDNARQAFSATGGDPWFLLKSPISVVFLTLAIVTVVMFSRAQAKQRSKPVNRDMPT